MRADYPRSRHVVGGVVIVFEGEGLRANAYDRYSHKKLSRAAPKQSENSLKKTRQRFQHANSSALFALSISFWKMTVLLMLTNRTTRLSFSQIRLMHIKRCTKSMKPTKTVRANKVVVNVGIQSGRG